MMQGDCVLRHGLGLRGDLEIGHTVTGTDPRRASIYVPDADMADDSSHGRLIVPYHWEPHMALGT